QHEIGIDQFTLVASLLLLAQCGERCAVGGAAAGEGERTLAVVNALVPIKVRAAILAKRRYHFAQLGMHARTVVALVVVFHDDLPVGGDNVSQLARTTQLRQWIALYSIRNRPKLTCEVVPSPRGVSGSQIEKEEPTPGLDANRVEGKIFLVQAIGFAQMRRAEQFSIKRVGPQMVRAADGPGGGHSADQFHAMRIFVAEARAAVPAYVVVCSQLSAFRTHHQDALARHIEDQG